MPHVAVPVHGRCLLLYGQLVEFDSYEAAMENSNRPEVGEYAARLAKLCDAPPRFYNLDVREAWQPRHDH